MGRDLCLTAVSEQRSHETSSSPVFRTSALMYASHCLPDSHQSEFAHIGDTKPIPSEMQLSFKQIPVSAMQKKKIIIRIALVCTARLSVSMFGTFSREREHEHPIVQHCIRTRVLECFFFFPSRFDEHSLLNADSARAHGPSQHTLGTKLQFCPQFPSSNTFC